MPRTLAPGGGDGAGAGRAGGPHGRKGAGWLVEAAGRCRARSTLAAKRGVAKLRGGAGGRVAGRGGQQRPGSGAAGVGHGADASPPVFAPVAAEMGEEVARAVGAAAAAALRGDSTDANGTGVDLGGDSTVGSDPPNRSGAGTPALASSANATEAGHSLPAANSASFDGLTPSLFGVPAADGEVQHQDLFVLAKTPNSADPNTWYLNPGSGQMRLFVPSGRPALDLDYDHLHGGI